MIHYDTSFDDIPMQLLPYLLEREGQRELSLEQTKQVRADLSDTKPSSRTRFGTTWSLDVELEEGGAGRLIVTLPHDRALSGTCSWTPTTSVWVDPSFSQEHIRFERASEQHDKTGGKAIAAALLSRLA